MIKVHLQKLDRNIIFQILEQSDQYYDIGTLKMVVNNIEVNIHSRNVPALSMIRRYRESRYYNGIYKIHIYLRGSEEEKHLKTCSLYLKNNKERDLVYNTILKSLDKLNKSIRK